MTLPDGSLNKPGFVRFDNTLPAHFKHILKNSLPHSGLQEQQQQQPLLGPYKKYKFLSSTQDLLNQKLQ